jgi:hypothetical protein
MVMVTAAAIAVLAAIASTIFPAIASAVFAGRRAVPRPALVAVELLAASATTAAMVMAIVAVRSIAARVGLGLRGLGGRTAEESFHPAEQTSGLPGFLGGRRGRRLGPAGRIAGVPA